MKHKPLLVFAGALGAFALVDGASVLVGGLIADLIPSFWINARARVEESYISKQFD